MRSAPARGSALRWTGRSALLLLLAVASTGAARGEGQEYWDPYAFVEPYGGFRSDASAGGENGWKGGVRLGREGWLAGWEGDLAFDFGETEATDRYQVSLDGYLKPLESRVSAIFVLVGFGGTRKLGGPDADSSILFHYRYGVGYRARLTERHGLRLDLTAIRSVAGDYSSREATMGWVIYY